MSVPFLPPCTCTCTWYMYMSSSSSSSSSSSVVEVDNKNGKRELWSGIFYRRTPFAGGASGHHHLSAVLPVVTTFVADYTNHAGGSRSSSKVTVSVGGGC